MSRRKYTEPLTLANLKLLNDGGKLWMNPDYQRGEVWTRAQKQLLIDSLLNDIDVPKVYLREISRGSFEFEVVDGQQRLRSIFDYLGGKLTLGKDSDPIGGYDVAGRTFEELPTDVQIRLTSKSLDVTRLVDYSDDDVEDMFLRLQNGTPLNAAEKRRALPGTTKQVIADLASHKLFDLAGFSNRRFGYEDAAAKALHLQITGESADIKPESIRRMYETHPHIDSSSPDVRILLRTWNFIARSFKGKQRPQLKKYAILTLSSVVTNLLSDFDLASYPKEFAGAYLEFEARRVKNSELEEDGRDQELSNYTEAARNDSVEAMALRRRILTRALLAALPQLRLLDPDRSFTDEQRFVIYFRDKGICRACHEPAEEGNWHADHVVPYSKGGPTSIENGQLLHVDCNLHKGAHASAVSA